jgi:hypothetical protein
MDGVALKTLTVSFDEYGFNKRLNKENRFGSWYTLTDEERDELGSTMGPSNPQALNRYSYVMGNPLKYTDPSGHDVDCLNFNSCGVVHNNSNQPVLVTGEKQIDDPACNGSTDMKCYEVVTYVLWPGESSTDYGIVDVDSITAVDSAHPIDGHGPDETYRLSGGEATISNDGKGGVKITPHSIAGIFSRWKPIRSERGVEFAIPPPRNIPPNVSIEQAMRERQK